MLAFHFGLTIARREASEGAREVLLVWLSLRGGWVVVGAVL
jgi:hypothetical protein